MVAWNNTRKRKPQKAILRVYDEDFEKQPPSVAMLAKLRLLWNDIPAQLAKENKKFVYTASREIAALVNAGVLAQQGHGRSTHYVIGK